MAKRNRTSFQKRDRERRKTEKAQRRRDRREGRTDASGDGAAGEAIVVDSGEYGIPESEREPSPTLEQPTEEEPRPDAA